MNLNELRIGNYIQYYGDMHGYVLSVADIGSPKIFVTAKGGGYTCTHDYEGILLTTEWLEKFGFEKPKNRDCYIKKRLQVWKQMAYLIEEDTLIAHWIPVKLEYVHQLQNLYFALTGEEL